MRSSTVAPTPSAVSSSARRRLRDDGPGRRDRTPRPSRAGPWGRWLDEAIAAGDDIGAELLLADPLGGGDERCLVDRSGREPQIEALAIRPREAVEAVAQRPVERVAKAGSAKVRPGSSCRSTP